MYKTSTIQPKTFNQVKVKNQDMILKITRSRLEPQKAWEVIRKETKDFTKDIKEAKQADELLMQLLKVNKIALPGESKEKTKVRLRLEEQERERALELLALELELAA
ncbi:MAG: hypothetical protein ABJQ69_03690 [Ekhidna sp.]